MQQPKSGKFKAFMTKRRNSYSLLVLPRSWQPRDGFTSCSQTYTMKLRSLLCFLLLAASANSVSLKKSRALVRNSLNYRKPAPPRNRTATGVRRTSPAPRLFLKAKKRSSHNSTKPLLQYRPGSSLFEPTPTASKRELDTRPTPQPTGASSITTTVHISDENDFSLIVPSKYGQKVSDAEADGICQRHPAGSGDCALLPEGFVTAAKYAASDDGSWVQVTGCIDPTAFPGMSPTDEGGQFDVRYPNGAQCTFGGYGASFIELLEPGTRRFCIRCCSAENDQINCNSHMDRQGCLNAIPGTYDFPEKGISCG